LRFIVQPIDGCAVPARYQMAVYVDRDLDAPVPHLVADVGQRLSNMGRRFTPDELRHHRDGWLKTVRDRPEVLIRAAQTQTETGPLEALLAELDFNLIAVSDGTLEEGFPLLATEQFRRAIATNALAALPEDSRQSVHRAYGLMTRVNYHFEEMARMDRSGGSGGTWSHDGTVCDSDGVKFNSTTANQAVLPMMNRRCLHS
jgi:hypothetical protein